MQSTLTSTHACLDYSSASRCGPVRQTRPRCRTRCSARAVAHVIWPSRTMQQALLSGSTLWIRAWGLCGPNLGRDCRPCCHPVLAFRRSVQYTRALRRSSITVAVVNFRLCLGLHLWPLPRTSQQNDAQASVISSCVASLIFSCIADQLPVALQTGDKLPSIVLYGSSPKDEVELSAYVAGKTVVMFGVPGAFTPGCSKVHTHFDSCHGHLEQS